MPTPTLFIGLGTSGLKMLEETQRLFYGTLGDNKPDHVEFIFTETDSKVDRKPTPRGDDIREVMTPLEAPTRGVEYLRSLRMDPAPDIDWLPAPDLLEHTGVGAGGMRSFGRLALWSMPSNGQDLHMSQLEREIRSAFQRLGNDQSVHVYIVSSLAGGTGSGTFIDVAYLTRFCIDPNFQHSVRIYGLFLLPPSFGQNERMLANGYACLRDLQHYGMQGSQFLGRWPMAARPPQGFPKGASPFLLATFMSPDWGGNATVSYDHLVKLASVFLFSASLGFSDHRGRRVVDAMNYNEQGRFGKYSFVSLSVLLYPRLEIEESAAIDFAIEYLERLTNRNECFGHLIKGNIEAEANRKAEGKLELIDDLILDALSVMSDAGPAASLEAYIDDEIEKIVGKDIAVEPDEHIRNLFRSQETEKLYQFVKPKVIDAEKRLIVGLESFLTEAIEKSESLTYGRLMLQRAHDYLANTIQFWRAFQIETWDPRLDGLVAWSVDFPARYVPGEKGRILRERLRSILELLKMHHFLPRLEKICQHILRRDVEEFRSTAIPTLVEVDSFIKSVRYVCKEAGGEETDKRDSRRPANARRLTDKRAALNDRGDTPRQIHEYYPQGSFQREVEEAKSAYRGNARHAADSESKLVFGYNSNLWQHLRESESKIYQELYDRPVNSYVRLLREHECVHDLEIGEFISTQPKALVELAARAIESPLMLTRPIVNAGDDYPKMIITAERATQEEAKTALREEGSNEFDNQGPHAYVACPDLKNMIIFLDERGDFSPLKDISNMENWRAACQNEESGKINAYGIDEEASSESETPAEETAAQAVEDPAESDPIAQPPPLQPEETVSEPGETVATKLSSSEPAPVDAAEDPPEPKKSGEEPPEQVAPEELPDKPDSSESIE